jgi:segregation and condensation protein A
MNEEPKKETQASEAPAALTSAGTTFPESEDNDNEPFSYFLEIGDVYDGPLDLLLDLIKKQNLDIWDLPIGKITAQFLAYVKTIPSEEADSAAEFCYMASQLIVIKSRMLLPIERGAAENGTAEDPRKSLIERLLEYEQVKQAAQMLGERQKAESATWTRSDADTFRDAAIPSEALSAQPADAADLSSVFRQILERATNRPTLTVTNDAIMVRQMVDYLRDRLEIEDAPISLEEAIGGSSSPRIVTAAILALLEMVRLGAVLLRQDAQWASIRIKKSPKFQQVMDAKIWLEE